MSDPRFADSRLADVLWWLHGFNAAQPAMLADFSPQPVSIDLASGIRGVRSWIEGLAKGRTRLIGTNDRELGAVLAEHELEVIHDGLREGAAPAELESARELVSKVLKQIGVEYREMLQGEAPF